MTRDLENADDIKTLVDSFYEKVKHDSLLQPMFAHIDWDAHLPVMYQFWNNAIFYTGGYNGNPLQTHQAINARASITREQFDRWVHLFTETTDELFSGEKATLAKQRAIAIATVMQIKLNQ